MKFIQQAKRRKNAGIYVARTDRHFGGGRVVGYVGRSWNVPQRILCHQGECGRHKNCTPKDWTILLNTRFHWVRVPWWLSWKWSMAGLEALAIWVLLPLYNVQLNTKNPRRVTKRDAMLQRAARERASRGYLVARKVRGSFASPGTGARPAVCGGRRWHVRLDQRSMTTAPYATSGGSDA